MESTGLLKPERRGRRDPAKKLLSCLFSLSPPEADLCGGTAVLKRAPGWVGPSPAQLNHTDLEHVSLDPPRCHFGCQDASGSNARRIISDTSRILACDSIRDCLSTRRALGRVVTKWPLSQDGSGRPVSPGSNKSVVGPSTPILPKGTIRTVFARSL